MRPTHSRGGSQADAISLGLAAAAGAAGGGEGVPHQASRAPGGFSVTPGSSQPGTPLSTELPGAASGDGSGSGAEGGGGEGGSGGGAGEGHVHHHRVPSRLATGSGARGGEGGGPLERLRLVGGNRRCTDCGAQDPDWASLNLGVLLCIECSGVHRQLGVQVSKVRSCTLDVKVWEPSVIMVFEAIGNDYSNKVWEACLQAPGVPGGGGAAAARAADSWVWCDDDSGEEEEGPAGQGQGRGSSSGGGRVGRRSSSSGRRRQVRGWGWGGEGSQGGGVSARQVWGCGHDVTAPRPGQ